MTNRRTFLRTGALLGASVSLPRFASRAWAQSATPHFFLQVVYNAGWCPSYLFDARPRAFTAAGLQQNSHPEGSESFVWSDSEGVETLAAPAAQNLLPVKDLFSIVKGVHCSPDFDGHLQNMNVVLSGSPFGGEYLAPHINQSQRSVSQGLKTPFDFLNMSQFPLADFSNGSASMPMNKTLAIQLQALAEQAAAPTPIQRRASEISGAERERLGLGTGLFAQGARDMQQGLADSVVLQERLARLRVVDSEDESLQATAAAMGCFRAGVSRSALVGVFENLDAHDAQTAAAQVENYQKITLQIRGILEFLRDTPFDEARGLSFLDVTTVSFNSEFGRTMRQARNPIERSGTDHNPLNNLVLLAGRGIRTNRIFGASDLDELNESGNGFAPVSRAHISRDPSLVKTMGFPFDVESGQVRRDVSPDVYNQRDYLTIGSISNTLLHLFGVSQDKFQLDNDRENPQPHPVMQSLLV